MYYWVSAVLSEQWRHHTITACCPSDASSDVITLLLKCRLLIKPSWCGLRVTVMPNVYPCTIIQLAFCFIQMCKFLKTRSCYLFKVIWCESFQNCVNLSNFYHFMYKHIIDACVSIWSLHSGKNDGRATFLADTRCLVNVTCFWKLTQQMAYLVVVCAI